MKNILLITTGGTIASRATQQGLAPQMDAEEMLRLVPKVCQLCHVDTLPLYSIDSTDMEPKHWVGIAKALAAHYDAYDGFVVLHGTDTMSYTASALSYLAQNLAKPVVLTGSQRPIDRESSDARENLYGAFAYAARGGGCGVTIVFDGRVIAGTRARKVRTKSFNAFTTVDFPDLARVRDGRVIRYIPQPQPACPPRFYEVLNERVFVLKMTPGLDPVLFPLLMQHYDALVIESFGFGGIPSYNGDAFLRAVKGWVDSGRHLVMTTQVPHEGSDMDVYQVGVRVKREVDLMEAYDMTLESVVTKLMWILAQTREPAAVRELFYTPVQFDIVG